MNPAHDGDYYVVLEVARDASGKDIKRAYRTMARRYHPDHNPDDPAAADRFMAVHEAYTVLSNPRTRARYDATLGGRFRSPAGRTYRYGPDGTFAREADGVTPPASDLFSHVIDVAAGLVDWVVGSVGARPVEARYTIPVSLAQALAGGRCNFKTADGKSIRVTLPENMPDRYETRAKSQTGRTFRLRFKVRQDGRFERRGWDLTTTVTINSLEAMLGTSHDTKTPYGNRVTITVPPGTVTGDQLRIDGHGVQTKEKAGDLLLSLKVTPLNDLNSRQRELLRKAASEAGLL